MLVPAVDAALESFLRATMPLPEHEGDVSFDAPTSTWAAQVNRITLNAYLYQVARSAQPPRAAATRPGDGGRMERRPALPLVELSYLVSAWAGSVRDEHALLGDALTRFLSGQVLPAWAVEHELESNIQVAVATDAVNRPRELWGALGAGLKASFTLVVTVAAPVHDWEVAPPQVTGVAASTQAVVPGAASAR